MEINFVAVFVAALVPMALSFIWYNPKVFGTAWMNATGLKADDRPANMALMLGLSFFFSLMLAWIMNLFAIHDSWIGGAMYYATKGTMQPEAGSELAKWYEYYNTNLAASNHNFKHGAFHGLLLAGLFVALPIIATNAVWERRGWKYVAITAGYWIVNLTIMGGIVAAWR